MPKEINLSIVLQNPVDGVIYGLQKGKGTDYETVQAQPGNGQDLTFDFVIQVKEAGGSLPTLTGPYVQNAAGNRFVYIGIGSYAGQTGALISGRLKVPLPETAFEDTSSDGGNYVWSCTVPGRSADGKPVFATVKPFGRWSKHRLSK